MKKLVLVRYGQYVDSHLTDEGMRTMERIAQVIKFALVGASARVVAAEVPRAIESARVVVRELGISSVDSFPQLYAAEEAGRLPMVQEALVLLRSFPEDVVVAIISREYIEPISQSLLGAKEVFRLERGEALIIDLVVKKATYLK
jgi:hypothetical protein